MIKNLLLSTLQAIGSRRGFGIVLVAALLALRIWEPHTLEELRLRSFDLYQSIRPRQSELRPVVIIDIDEASVKAYGQWPWPRTLLADLVDRLHELGVAAIAFDVVFAEPDRTSPREAVKHFRNVDDTTRHLLSQLPSNDELFAESISRGKVVLGQSGAAVASGSKIENPPETGFATLGADPLPYLVTFPNILRNLPELEKRAAGRGLFSIQPERDGIVRRVPIVMKVADRIVPAVTLDLLRVVTGSGAILIRTDEAGVRSVAIPGLEMPTDRNGRIWVHFSRHDPTKYISATDVIEGRVAPERITGKLAILGTSAIGLLDVKTTPVDAAMPGVEVHAQLLEAALTDALLSSPNYAIAIELLGAAFAGLLLALISPFASALALFTSAVLAATTFIAGSWLAYIHYQTLFDATFPVGAILAVYLSLVIIGYFREQMDRRRIRSAFAQYLSPTLVERLAQSRKQLVLGGEDRIMTVLFSDVRDFTSISETYKENPHGLTTLMNRFLTPLTNAIVSRNGTIDKYIGDAIMAFWNAPLDNPHQESDACHAALDMLEHVKTLNAERQKEEAVNMSTFIPIEMGIGINTGRCTVGNMGSDLRFQYTVMGDTVNLASRLEGQTRTHGLSIIIGSQTAVAVKDEFALVEIELIRVKGRIEPEVIYTIVGRRHVMETHEFKSFHEKWSKLLLCYRNRDWEGALEAADLARNDCICLGLAGLMDTYIDRIRRLAVSPPDSNWKGVFVADTK